jgi:GH35 family endo-1,4-beta-xylanase
VSIVLLHILLIIGLAWAAFMLCSIPVVHGQRAPKADLGTSVLPDRPLHAFRLMGNLAHLARTELRDDVDAPGGKAVRVIGRNGAGQEWAIQLSQPTVVPVRRGDVLLARFWLRCIESMSGEGSAGFVFERNGEPHIKSVEMRLGASRQWVEHFVPFRAAEDYGPGEAVVNIRLGYDRQTIEIAGLSVVNFADEVRYEDLPRTTLTYAGRASDAAWRREAEARIEKHRKQDLRIRVVDETGEAIERAAVEFVQMRHAFGFGTAVDAHHLLTDTADGERYRETVAKHFNLAVFENDMKWPVLFEGFPARTDKALAWLIDHGFVVRGHTLVWPSWRWMPTKLLDHTDDPERLRRITDEHIRQTVKHFHPHLFDWDVVNEPYSERDLIELLGGDAVMVDWFRAARAAGPGVRLFVNDFGIFDSGRGINEHEEHFFNTIRFLIEQGAPLDGIGIQSHFTTDLPSPAEIVRTLDRFATFGLPIVSTELSVDLNDRDLQADYLRDYMTAVFSHPAVDGIMLWGFWSGRHWRPEAGLWARDWTIRPHGEAFVNLIHRQWRTRESQETNRRGEAAIRGFRGSYEVRVRLNDGRSRVVVLDLEQEPTSVVVNMGRSTEQTEEMAVIEHAPQRSRSALRTTGSLTRATIKQ